MSKRLTWRRQPSETGLRRIAQSPRGYDLWLEGRRVASVRLSAGGYYWSAPTDEPLGIVLRNTASEEKYATIDDAKAACRAYIVACLKKKVGVL